MHANLPPLVPPRIIGGTKWSRFYIPNAAFVPKTPQTSVEQDEAWPSVSAAICGQEEAIWIQAGRDISMGGFLSPNLAKTFTLMQSNPERRATGLPLSGPQFSCLCKLGISERYAAVSETLPHQNGGVAEDRRICGATTLGALISMMLALRSPEPITEPRLLLILPATSRSPIRLRNRGSISSWLRARRAVVLDPDTMPFEQLTHCLATASCIIIAAPEQAGVLGLCSPDVKVLELAPDGAALSSVKAACSVFGLDWSLCLGSSPEYSVLTGERAFEPAGLSFEVPIQDLAHALGEMER